MRITPNSRIGRLLDLHPEVSEAMAWYGVELEDHHPDVSLEAVCKYHRLEVHDVLSVLLASIDEDEELDSEEESSGDLLPDDEAVPELEGAWGRGPGLDMGEDEDDSGYGDDP